MKKYLSFNKILISFFLSIAVFLGLFSVSVFNVYAESSFVFDEGYEDIDIIVSQESEDIDLSGYSSFEQLSEIELCEYEILFVVEDITENLYVNCDTLCDCGVALSTDQLWEINIYVLDGTFYFSVVATSDNLEYGSSFFDGSSIADDLDGNVLVTIDFSDYGFNTSLGCFGLVGDVYYKKVVQTLPEEPNNPSSDNEEPEIPSSDDVNSADNEVNDVVPNSVSGISDFGKVLICFSIFNLIIGLFSVIRYFKKKKNKK